MPKYFCPRCGTTLAEDFLVTAGKEFDCPKCRQLIRLDVVAPELARAAAEEAAAPGEAEPAAAEPAVEETPPGGRLQCRVVGQQLVLFVPPGSSKEVRSIGCFAALWLGFMAVFTTAAMFGGAMHGVGFIGPALFIALFWAVGLGMAYFWYRGRYGKTYVLVERDRLVVRFVLGKREKIKEYVLNENSQADLVESYKQNERPVYAVAVTTSARPAKFGTFLAMEEKQWIVERINRHLAK
jgi:DNA-directed RNA polymerase subunit RPC12/RpoP